MSNLQILDLSGNRLNSKIIRKISSNLYLLPNLYKLDLCSIFILYKDILIDKIEIQYLIEKYEESSNFPFYKSILLKSIKIYFSY